MVLSSKIKSGLVALLIGISSTFSYSFKSDIIISDDGSCIAPVIYLEGRTFCKDNGKIVPNKDVDGINYQILNLHEEAVCVGNFVYDKKEQFGDGYCSNIPYGLYSIIANIKFSDDSHNSKYPTLRKEFLDINDNRCVKVLVNLYCKEIEE